MALDPSLVGAPAEPVEFEWTERDVLHYAVSVGAGADDPIEELRFTTENSADHPLVVLPTFANIITRVARAPLGDYDSARLVHASQAMTLHKSIPISGRVVVTPTVIEMLDKGSGALATTEQRAVDAETGALIATTFQTVFIKGAGGFGGERGSSTRTEIPDRSPDVERPVSIRPEQALLYRLTGDRNPLHTDPAYARRGGFDRPILHGMCTYGFTGRVLMNEFGVDGALMEHMEARFTRPVVPPANLVVQMWHDSHEVWFRTMLGSEAVIDSGHAIFTTS